MMASVRGMVRRHVVPAPGVDSTSTAPPIRSMLVLTTSMPTPRPETLVTWSAVENPGSKTSIMMSRASIWDSWLAWITPRSMARFATLSMLMPAPSSLTSTVT
jgi:hypothetical protein